MEVSQWFFRTKMPALNVHFSLEPVLSSQAEASHLALVFLFSLFKKNIYLFTWLHWVLVAAGGLLSCGIRTLSCDTHVGSSSLTRDQTQASCIGSGVLSTVPPGKSRSGFSLHLFCIRVTEGDDILGAGNPGGR